MSSDVAADLTRDALLTAARVAGPVLVVILAATLAVAVLQTLTQLHDQTLSIVPRLIVAAIATLLLLPWMLESLAEYSTDLFHAARVFL